MLRLNRYRDKKTQGKRKERHERGKKNRYSQAGTTRKKIKPNSVSSKPVDRKQPNNEHMHIKSNGEALA